MSEFNERLLSELVDAVKEFVHKEESDRLRDVYLIGDIEKETARAAIEKLRELANNSRKPITLYVNSAGGNVTDGLALHDVVQHLVSSGIEITIVVQGMAYSMGSVVLQAASPGKRVAYPHSWIMIHEPAKWAGWQSTTAAAQHLDRLKQMQDQIYRILAERSGKPLRQIIRDTKRTDLYLDAAHARKYGLIDEVLGQIGQVSAPDAEPIPALHAVESPRAAAPAAAAAQAGDTPAAGESAAADDSETAPVQGEAAALRLTPPVERPAGSDDHS
jgi:ATP-dependent Clp protease, protease subunit